MAIDCSEMSYLMVQMGMSVAAETGKSAPADVLKEIHKIPGMEWVTEEFYSRALYDVGKANAETRRELVRGMEALKRTNKDPKIQREASDVQRDIEAGASPTPIGRVPPPGPKPESRASLEGKAKRLQQQIDRAKESNDLTRIANKFAREYLDNGGDPNAYMMTKWVHEKLKADFPDLTYAQTWDWIDAYGQLKEPAKDKTSVHLRTMKGVMLQLSKMRKMAKGIAPVLTGFKRPAPSDLERRLVKQVNEKKKLGGYVVTDPERELKSATDAYETRLRNQIKDLNFQIDEKKQIVPEKKERPSSPTIETLQAQRDILQKVYDEMFPKKPMTMDQRVALTEKMLAKSITEYKRRVAERDFSGKKTVPVTETENIKKLRAELSSIRTTYNENNPNSAKMRGMQAELDAINATMNSYYGQQAVTEPLARSPNNMATHMRALVEKARRTLKGSEEAAAFRYEASIERNLKKWERLGDSPTVDPDKASPELSKRLQYLKDHDNDLRTQIRRAQEALKPKTILGHAAEVVSPMRDLMTTFDMPIGRQGVLIAHSHPLLAVKAVVESRKPLVSHADSIRAEREIFDRPNGMNYRRDGLNFDSNDPHAPGEYFRSDSPTLDKYAPHVAFSKRIHIAQLNLLRADLYDMLVAWVCRGGEPTRAEGKLIANYINVATGKTDLIRGQQGAQLLGKALFSPSMMISRWQYALGTPLIKAGVHGVKTGNYRPAAAIGMEYGRTLAGIAVTAWIAKNLLGATVETDPRSSDFMALKWGNMRVDITGGLRQAIVFGARMLSGQNKSTKTKKVNDMYGPKHQFGQTDVMDVITNYGRSKLSPVLGKGVDLATRKTFTGQPVSLTHDPVGFAGWAAEGVLPMSASDVASAYRQGGVPQATITAMLSIMGFGVQNYDANKKRPKW